MQFDDSFNISPIFQKPRTAQRRLFSNLMDNSVNEHGFNVKKMLDEIYEQKKTRWNFDFVAGCPIESPNSMYSYREISATQLPSFYHTKEYLLTPKTPRKQWPPTRPDYLSDEEEDYGFFEQENRSPYRIFSTTTNNELNSSGSSLPNDSTSSSSISSNFFETSSNSTSSCEEEAQCSSHQKNCENILPQTTSRQRLRNHKINKTPQKSNSSPRKRITKTEKKSPRISLNGKFF